MSDTSSAYALPISNISGRERAEDAEQFDDILKTFIDGAGKLVGGFGMIRGEGEMFAVKNWMAESLLNFSFRGTTMSRDQSTIALENIIIDKVATVPTARDRQIDTRVPMDDGEHVGEGGQRIVDLALQALHKGRGEGK